MKTKGSIQEVKDGLEAKIQEIFPKFYVGFAENKDDHINLRIAIKSIKSREDCDKLFSITMKGYIYIDNSFGCGTLLHYINLINPYNSKTQDEYLVFDTTEYSCLFLDTTEYENDVEDLDNVVNTRKVRFFYQEVYIPEEVAHLVILKKRLISGEAIEEWFKTDIRFKYRR